MPKLPWTRLEVFSNCKMHIEESERSTISTPYFLASFEEEEGTQGFSGMCNRNACYKF